MIRKPFLLQASVMQLSLPAPRIIIDIQKFNQEVEVIYYFKIVKDLIFII